MTSGTGRESFARSLGRKLVLIVPLMGILVALEKSGVPAVARIAVLAAIPFAAALLPAVARRWSVWGEAFCFSCAIAGMIAVMPKDADFTTMMVSGLAMGFAALLSQAATGRIARRVAA